ncbi:DUF3077 domain-containing protein [Pseudomonas aeruginosa]|uniref:DUF3077 domain-containing protein n=1 Tax=Pseudomonas aeruginosa TaxID=287 RepID=UPI002DD74ED2|nr:DUF3077 domain-containing protein [Pseudomonas aeruginosa]
MIRATTKTVSFNALIGLKSSPLFSVNSGAPITEVIENVSSMLDIARSLTRKAEGEPLEANCVYAIEMIITQAKAAVDAVWEGLREAEQAESSKE